MENHFLVNTTMSFLLISVQFIILPLDWLQKLTFLEICNKCTEQLMRIAIAICNHHLVLSVFFDWLQKLTFIEIHIYIDVETR